MKQIDLNIAREKRFEETECLSELIEIALEDLEAAEQAENVDVDMSEWYVSERQDDDWNVETNCKVCLAGSVMRFTFSEETKKLISRYWGLDPYMVSVRGSVRLNPIGYRSHTDPNDELAGRLVLLNEVRGLVENSRSRMSRLQIILNTMQGIPGLKRARPVLSSDGVRSAILQLPAHRYAVEPDGFKTTLRSLIEIFRSAEQEGE